MSYTISHCLQDGQRTLKNANIEDALRSAQVLLAQVLQCSASYLIAHGESIVSQKDYDLYQSWIQKRSLSVPVAYIIQKKEFYGMEFFVNESVLIPRPETEMIVDWVRTFISKHPVQTLLDIGTGSGILPIAIKHHCPSVSVTGVDISENALAVAKINAQRHATEGQWIQSDLFENVTSGFDCIVSNLPYIQDMDSLPLDVQYEPRLALDGKDQGLEIIFTLIDQTADYLHTDGALVLEYGFDQAQSIVSKLRKKRYKNITVHQDLAGLDRMITARKG